MTITWFWIYQNFEHLRELLLTLGDSSDISILLGTIFKNLPSGLKVVLEGSSQPELVCEKENIKIPLNYNMDNTWQFAASKFFEACRNNFKQIELKSESQSLFDKNADDKDWGYAVYSSHTEELNSSSKRTFSGILDIQLANIPTLKSYSQDGSLKLEIYGTDSELDISLSANNIESFNVIVLNISLEEKIYFDRKGQKSHKMHVWYLKYKHEGGYCMFFFFRPSTIFSRKTQDITRYLRSQNIRVRITAASELGESGDFGLKNLHAVLEKALEFTDLKCIKNRKNEQKDQSCSAVVSSDQTKIVTSECSDGQTVNNEEEDDSFLYKNRASTLMNSEQFNDIVINCSGPNHLIEDFYMEINHWKDLQIDPTILSNITSSDRLNWIKPTPIQNRCLPILLNRKNVMCAAHSGLGKTGAYAISLLTSIKKLERPGNSNGIKPYALVVGPTQNSVLQIHFEFLRLAKNTGIRCEYLVKGNCVDQLKRCTGCDILVTSICQLKDFINKKEVTLDYCKFLIIDDADKVFESRFKDDLDDLKMRMKGLETSAVFSQVLTNEHQIIAGKYICGDYLYVTSGIRINEVETEIPNSEVDSPPTSTVEPDDDFKKKSIQKIKDLCNEDPERIINFLVKHELIEDFLKEYGSVIDWSVLCNLILELLL